MEKLEDLENIIDTLSVLISEIEDKELKKQIEDYRQEFYIEKEELETNLQVAQAEFETECRRDLATIRL
jgi:L-arabinose isomerase